MISIYTHSNNPLTKEFWKYIAKKLIRKYSGPDAVLDSLIRGLTELDIPFEINPTKPKYNIIHILSGISALKERTKNKKVEQTLIVGPTLVVTPNDYNSLIHNSNIDIILNASKWVSDFFKKTAPNLINKIYVWPSGVNIPNRKSAKTGPIIIFKKNIPIDIFNQIINILKIKKIDYKIFTYGSFSRKKYLKTLKKTPLLIYLQSSETQGLALQEAWSYDIPTLVYQNTKWISGEYTWEDSSLSAPYLTDECGLFFTMKNFETQLENIKNKNLYPQKYCIKNLSDKKSVELLIKVITDKVKK